MIAAEIAKGRAAGLSPDALTETLTVAIGAELTKLVPGRVSTEVDACLSFDTDASVDPCGVRLLPITQRVESIRIVF